MIRVAMISYDIIRYEPRRTGERRGDKTSRGRGIRNKSTRERERDHGPTPHLYVCIAAGVEVPHENRNGFECGDMARQ